MKIGNKLKFLFNHVKDQAKLHYGVSLKTDITNSISKSNNKSPRTLHKSQKSDMSSQKKDEITLHKFNIEVLSK